MTPEPLPMPDDEDTLDRGVGRAVWYYALVLLAPTVAAASVAIARPGAYAEAGFVFLFVVLAIYLARLLYS